MSKKRVSYKKMLVRVGEMTAAAIVAAPSTMAFAQEEVTDSCKELAAAEKTAQDAIASEQNSAQEAAESESSARTPQRSMLLMAYLPRRQAQKSASSL